MKCEKCKNLINDLVEGELDEQIAEQVSSHIFSCQSCEHEFELLNNEKEMYAHFLFEIEPPSNLVNQFKAKIEVENEEIPNLRSTNWVIDLFAQWNLKPILLSAMALLIFGFGYFWIKSPTNKIDDVVALTQENPNSIPTASVEKKEIQEPESKITLPKIVKIKTIQQKKIEKESEKTTVIKTKTVVEKANVVTANLPLNKKTIMLENKPQNIVESPKLSVEDEMRLKEIQAFETETARQLEKVEMLLRSFRNTRLTEGSEEYDIAYEKQQARKLLAKNIQLRQQSENYGSLLTTELLSKVEPYLLEISNLDNNPTTEEVLEIKQRVKNQNIIVSLQSFGL